MARRSEDAGPRRTPFEKAVLYFRIGMWVITAGALIYLGWIYYQRYSRSQESRPVLPAGPVASAPASAKEESDNEPVEERTFDTRTLQMVKEGGPKMTPAHAASDNAEAGGSTVLNTVRDRVPIEPEALYYLLREVNRTTDNDFFMLRAPRVTLRQVSKDPDGWRGRPVTLTWAM